MATTTSKQTELKRKAAARKGQVTRLRSEAKQKRSLAETTGAVRPLGDPAGPCHGCGTTRRARSGASSTAGKPSASGRKWT